MLMFTPSSWFTVEQNVWLAPFCRADAGVIFSTIARHLLTYTELFEIGSTLPALVQDHYFTGRYQFTSASDTKPTMSFEVCIWVTGFPVLTK